MLIPGFLFIFLCGCIIVLLQTLRKRLGPAMSFSDSRYDSLSAGAPISGIRPTTRVDPFQRCLSFQISGHSVAYQQGISISPFRK